MSELFRAGVVPNRAAAELAVNQLELEGIPAMRRVTDFGAGATDAFSWAGQQEILVREDDLKRARALLKGSEDGDEWVPTDNAED